MEKAEKIISIIQIVSAAVWLACVIFDIVYKQRTQPSSQRIQPLGMRVFCFTRLSPALSR